MDAVNPKSPPQTDGPFFGDTGSHGACFALAHAARMQQVTAVGFVGGRRACEHLEKLGLIPGIDVDVLKNDGHGPLLLRVGNTRLALDAKLARRVLVTPAQVSYSGTIRQ